MNVEKFFKTNVTNLYRAEIEKCNNKADYFRINDPNRSAYGKYNEKPDARWSAEYRKLMNNVMTYNSKIAELSLVNRNTSKKWESQCPKKREYYVAICCIFGLGVKTCSKMLKRYGLYRALDKNNTEDIIFIRLLERCQRSIENFKSDEISFYKDFLPYYNDVKSILDKNRFYQSPLADNMAKEKLAQIGDDKFFDMYKQAIKNSSIWASALDREITNCFKKIGYQYKDSFYKEKNLPSIFSKAMSNLSREEDKLIPNRYLLISLMLHMGLPLKKMDDILRLAKMDTLMVKNPYENALVFILSYLYKIDSDYAENSVMLSEKNTDMQKKLQGGSLYNYVYLSLKNDDFKRMLDDEFDVDSLMYKN